MQKFVFGSAALLLLSCGTSFAAEPRSDASCRQETRRVVVWPHGPKASSMTRLVTREVTVCDAAQASQPSGQENHKS